MLHILHDNTRVVNLGSSSRTRLERLLEFTTRARLDQSSTPSRKISTSRKCREFLEKARSDSRRSREIWNIAILLVEWHYHDSATVWVSFYIELIMFYTSKDARTNRILDFINDNNTQLYWIIPCLIFFSQGMKILKMQAFYINFYASDKFGENFFTLFFCKRDMRLHHLRK